MQQAAQDVRERRAPGGRSASDEREQGVQGEGPRVFTAKTEKVRLELNLSQSHLPLASRIILNPRHERSTFLLRFWEKRARGIGELTRSRSHEWDLGGRYVINGEKGSVGFDKRKKRMASVNGEKNGQGGDQRVRTGRKEVG